MNVKTIKKDGYNLHIIKTKKFKKIAIKAIFWNELKKEELSLITLLVDNLLFSSKEYNTKRKMAIKKADLYNINLNGGSYINGNQIITEFVLSYIEDKYTEKGNSEEAIEFFFNCLTKPNIDNNSFDKTSFEITKERLLKAIKKEKESPGYVSNKGFLKELNSNEIYSDSVLGNEEDINSITPEILYNYYKDFFKNNHIDIFVSGNLSENEESLILNRLKFFENKKNIPYSNKYITYKKELTEKIEDSKFNQSIIKMGASLKNLTKNEINYDLAIYSMILGNGPSSKLFKEIREKNSFAYSIRSSIISNPGIFEIIGGISFKNFENTKKETLKQIEEMKKGSFTEKDIKSAKQYILSFLNEVEDSQWQTINYYFNQLYFDQNSIQDSIENIKKINKQNIINVAKKINIDTIYLLKEDTNEKDKN